MLRLGHPMVLLTKEEYRDVAFTASFRTQAAGSAFGLITRSGPPEQTIKVEFHGDSAILHLPDGRKSLEFRQVPGKWHQAVLVAFKQHVMLFIDREKLASTRTDARLAPGPLGLYCERGEVEFRALYRRDLDAQRSPPASQP